MDLDICVPYWGDPDQFLSTIASVQAQTDPRWRLTIIDDCYPGTRVADYVATVNDPRIRYRRNERNVGITENFRRAVDAAEGSHVVVLGSDDLLLPDYVAHVRETIAAFPDVDVIQPGVRVIDGGGAPARTLVDTIKQRLLTPRRAATFRGERMAATLLRGNWLYWPSLVLRVDVVRSIGFRDGLPIILDLALLVDIAFSDGTLRYTRVPCFAYRRHSESLSQTSLRDGSRFEDERRFYRDTAIAARARGWKRAERAARLRLMSRLHALSQLWPLGASDTARRAAWLLAVGR
ncbi:glycosyltransferase family 2 protein [Microbacterium sp. VKM Ac-2870]|uniref:glycosyltransferase family 2 protein n=1 Tax=Microbacterium sp. VKM Ac-2870 TaxID=2783825 RepID=UPI00188BE8EF|nr:glycosyltransferase family 2 protein [Microbacterium sp. VKM Ac-2870]MBF4561691.1 glycosyltransferase family 2 protein [Microbacterium sp. VKM Ac-2870]